MANRRVNEYGVTIGYHVPSIYDPMGIQVSFQILFMFAKIYISISHHHQTHHSILHDRYHCMDGYMINSNLFLIAICVAGSVAAAFTLTLSNTDSYYSIFFVTTLWKSSIQIRNTKSDLLYINLYRVAPCLSYIVVVFEQFLLIMLLIVYCY